ncbi:SusD/RagB family nutrient-binding outer membrane lipoprotein [Parapedobacter koreensis]|uniref:Susd and RagB outer membrane lipoprotein n=1 Tax=Parapedobacter koreensis TaxID=332977 RepID=A0A1H7G896_9SPHI|nr:SusD/RagB family nutrient-binding outer membrane lipoprotein [Parapedobacter koreensis]SEK34369.1 Susd and RagB outer membrane lipoprotein [Parapedobacter koreensis]
MKKIIIACMMFLGFSCTNDLVSLNEDLKNATVAAPGSFFANALKDMADEMNDISYQVNGGVTRLFAQQLTSVQFLEGTHYVAESQTNTLWRTIYSSVLPDLVASAEGVRNTNPVGTVGEITQRNQLAMIEIMIVYAYAMLVEGFGDIPYSEALDFDNVQPTFDDARTIYIDLINRLSGAVNNLDPSGAGFDTYDLLYQNDVAKWKKFGNALKLKMGMRIIDADPELGGQTVSSAISDGVFTSNADNALFRYLDEVPNVSPFYLALLQRQVNYFVATNTIIDLMNEYGDARRSVFFTTVNGAYIGGTFGLPQNFGSFSTVGQGILTPSTPTVLLDYQTVEFLLAEAAERDITGVSDAEAHYNAAIRASFAYYNVGDGADSYLAQPGVAYGTASGTWKQKIGVQKWLALFNQGFEAWTEYRRLDYPLLTAPPAAILDVVPTRFSYPFEEQTLNAVNYNAAASAIGGDLMTTKLFWDLY